MLQFTLATLRAILCSQQRLHLSFISSNIVKFSRFRRSSYNLLKVSSSEPKAIRRFMKNLYKLNIAEIGCNFYKQSRCNKRPMHAQTFCQIKCQISCHEFECVWRNLTPEMFDVKSLTELISVDFFYLQKLQIIGTCVVA